MAGLPPPGQIIYQANGSNAKPMAPTCDESSENGGACENPREAPRSHTPHGTRRMARRSNRTKPHATRPTLQKNKGRRLLDVGDGLLVVDVVHLLRVSGLG